MANSYILHSKGFYKGRSFNAKEMLFEVAFTNILEEAVCLSSKKANEIIKSILDGKGTIWKPREQRKVEESWICKGGDMFLGRFTPYFIERRFKEGYSDVDFLNNKSKYEIITEKQAEKIKNKKNQEIIDKILSTQN